MSQIRQFIFLYPDSSTFYTQHLEIKKFYDFYHCFNRGQLQQRCEKLHCRIEDPDHFDDDLDQDVTEQIQILAYDANPDDVKCYGLDPAK